MRGEGERGEGERGEGERGEGERRGEREREREPERERERERERTNTHDYTRQTLSTEFTTITFHISRKEKSIGNRVSFSIEFSTWVSSTKRHTFPPLPMP